MMRVAGEKHVHAGILDGVQRQFLPADCPLQLIADLQREQGVMGDQHAHRVGRRSRKGLAAELDLVPVDPPVLESQRPRSVDPKHRHAGQFDEGAKALVDESAVPRQRRQEAAKHVVKRHVMVAGDAKHLVPVVAQALEEMAGFAELLGSGPLGEVATDHDEARLQRAQLGFDRFDQRLIVRTEVQVGKVDQASHGW